jgi:hypothetical protein
MRNTRSKPRAPQAADLAGNALATEDDFFSAEALAGGGGGLDDESPPTLFAPPPPGAAVLPSECGFSMDQLVFRINAQIPPETAEEYVARARVASQALPRVVRALVRDEQCPPAKRLAAAWTKPAGICTASLLDFSPAHRQHVVQEFSSARQALATWQAKMDEDEAVRANLRPARFPQRQERLQWMEYCFGADGDTADSGTPPLLHVVLQMDFVVAVRVLKYISKVGWLVGAAARG